jgi:hypothetical protein
MKTMTLALAAALGAALPAQKMPLPEAGDRLVQVIDLTPLLPAGEAGRGGGSAPTSATAAIATFVRRFVDPPLRAGDDVAALGDRWLVVLGSQRQAACAEQLIQRAVLARDDHLQTTIRIMDLTAEEFATLLLPLFPGIAAAEETPAVRQMILDGRKADELLTALGRTEVRIMHAPRLMAAPLQRASLSAGEEITYVKDFTLIANGKAVVAKPVLATVWNGVQVDLIAGYTGRDRVGVHCTLELRDVAEPIAEFETTLPGTVAPVTVQLPRTTAVRLQRTAELAIGSTVLIANQKADGSWMAALVDVRRGR